MSWRRLTSKLRKLDRDAKKAAKKKEEEKDVYDLVSETFQVEIPANSRGKKFLKTIIPNNSTGAVQSGICLRYV